LTTPIDDVHVESKGANLLTAIDVLSGGIAKFDHRVTECLGSCALGLDRRDV
jgi:hypothetical protein